MHIPMSNTIHVCPDCLQEIESRDVAADGTRAVCRRCDGIVHLSDELAVTDIPDRPEKPSKARLKIERTDDTLFIDEPPVRGLVSYLFVFCCLFFAGMMIFCIYCAIYEVTPQPNGHLIFWGMAAFWLIPLSFSVYYILVAFFYHRQYRFDPEKLQMDGRLFFLRSHRTTPRSHIWGIRSDWAQMQTGKIILLGLVYEKTVYSIRCRSFEEQLWASAEISDYLDSTVIDRLCCPACNRGVIDDKLKGKDENLRKCTWCGCVVDQQEAARLGEDEIDDPYRSEYDLLRPLDSPIKLEQDDSELVIHFGQRGTQSTEDKIGVAFVVTIGLAMIPEIVFLFYPSWEVRMLSGMLLVLNSFFFGLFGWLATTTYWTYGTLRIRREKFCIECGIPFYRTKKIELGRSSDAVAKLIYGLAKNANTVQCTAFGKYRFIIYNGDEKRILINMRSSEEIRWLCMVVNRFLYRTKPEPGIIKPTCRYCKAHITLKNFNGDENEKLICTNCGTKIAFSEILPPEVEQWKPDPLKRPPEAHAIVNRTELELLIDYPSQAERQGGKRDEFQMRVVFYCFFILIAVWFAYYLGNGVFAQCQLFFQVFDPVKATLMSVFVGGVLLAAPCMYFLMFWGIGNSMFTSWKLRIDRQKVALTTKAFFTTRTVERDLTPEFKAESVVVDVLERQGFKWRKWFSISYWFDAEPAWSRDHILLKTDPPLPFPYREKTEKEWLLAVINDFLK